jgi:hypothetical protein
VVQGQSVQGPGALNQELSTLSAGFCVWFSIAHEPDEGRACRFLHAKAQEKGFRLQAHEGHIESITLGVV